MKLIEKKCPNCGANLEFKDTDKSCKCSHCGSSFEKNPLAIPLTSDDGLRVEKENNIKLLTNIHLCAIVDM